MDVKPPSWFPVSLVNSRDHSKVATAHSWPHVPFAPCERTQLCFLDVIVKKLEIYLPQASFVFWNPSNLMS